MNIQEQFCDSQTSKRLKDIGYNEKCFQLWKGDKLMPLIYHNSMLSLPEESTAPTWMQAEEFLLYKYNVYISIQQLVSKKFSAIVASTNQYSFDTIPEEFNCPIMARKEAIRSLIKIKHEK